MSDQVAPVPDGPGTEPASPQRRKLLSGAAIGAVGLLAGFGARVATEPDAVAPDATAPDVVKPETALASTAPNSSAPNSSALGSTAPATGASPTSDSENRLVEFYGEHQAGITTAQQEQMMFAAFDVTTRDPIELQHLLGRWAAVAARFAAGKSVSGGDSAADRPPTDTGESVGSGPFSLTITVGFGASLFDQRFGLADKMPAALRPFGSLPGEGSMKSELTGGDLCVQACADDPQVVFHAIRNMTRIARGTAVLRWSQLGFGRASATGAGQRTPRNLFGFKDGTRNIHADQAEHIEQSVWVGADTDQQWMRGGSYLVARKIAMTIESWDATKLSDQEQVFGRAKDSGAPLSGGDEFAEPNYQAVGTDGQPVIDLASHIRLAAPENNNGIRLLRRGYNYTDGLEAKTGRLDAGLFFIAFCRDPEQFRVLQSRLGQFDLLNEYIVHVGGGTWACPPGVSKAGDWFGKSLFA